MESSPSISLAEGSIVGNEDSLQLAELSCSSPPTFTEMTPVTPLLHRHSTSRVRLTPRKQSPFKRKLSSARSKRGRLTTDSEIVEIQRNILQQLEGMSATLVEVSNSLKTLADFATIGIMNNATQ